MSQENVPGLVEMTRRQFDAVNRHDLDALMSRLHPDAVYDTTPAGVDVFEGPAAIRVFVGEWWGAFEDLAIEPEEILDLGHGIVFVVARQSARPATSTGQLQRREAYVVEWVDDMIWRVAVYTDIDEARAAAEQLAREREQAFLESPAADSNR